MSRRWLALGLAVPLILGACGSDEDSGAKEGANVIDITLTDAGCLPRSISTKAGPTTFKVTNDDSAGVSEFEILSGKKILGEVENIIPGVPKSFSLTLKEGSYVTYCPGGESFEKGVLEVAANTSVAPTSPEAMARWRSFCGIFLIVTSRPFLAKMPASLARTSGAKPVQPEIPIETFVCA